MSPRKITIWTKCEHSAESRCCWECFRSDELEAEQRGREAGVEECVRACLDMRVKWASKLRVSGWEVANACLNAIRALAKGE